jgi:hypothetical protein
MAKLTRQQYYNKLVKCALDGTFPATDHSNFPEYRTDDGRRCAVGILIPKKKYDPKIEDHNVNESIVKDGGYVTVPKGMTYKELYGVQDTHDRICNEQDFTRLFLDDLNALDCFKKVKQVDVDEALGTVGL